MTKLITDAFKRDLFLLISNTYLEFLKENTPVKSGNLKREWKLIELESLVYLILNEAEYAKFLEEGTGIYGPKKKPILIKPKFKKALSFNFGGMNVVVKSAKIKGIKPLQLIQKAISSKKLAKDLDKGLQKIFEKHFFNF